MKSITMSIALFFILGVISEALGRRDLVEQFSGLAGVGVVFLTLAIIFRGLVNLVTIMMKIFV